MKEFVVELVCFGEVLLLHLVSHFAVFTLRVFLRKQQLINDDVVCINLLSGQFLYESLRLVQG